jgi:hypothetical protein
MAVGYATHLLTDIVAHNYFVPAHEAMWFRGGLATHAISEWAMDAHISPHLFVQPASLISHHRGSLVNYAHKRLGLDRAVTKRALSCLMHGENLLRRSRLPQLLYRATRSADRAVRARFDHYIHETAGRLPQIDRLIAGETPAWLPEPEAAQHGHAHRDAPKHHPYLVFLPADFFRDVKTR